MPQIENKNNKVWIYVSILVFVIIVAVLWLAYFQGNEAPMNPAPENGFKGPTAEEQEELLERITGPGESPDKSPGSTGPDSGGSNFEEKEVDNFFEQEPTPGFSQEEKNSFFNE